MKHKERNIKELKSFAKYCVDYPEQRFWQALRNWAFDYYHDDYADGSKPEIHYIFCGYDDEAMVDTFYWESKNELENVIE